MGTEMECGHHVSMLRNGACVVCAEETERSAFVDAVSASEFLRGYLDCLVWLGTRDDENGSGEPIDDEVSADDLAERLTLAELREIQSDCAGFQELAADALRAIEESGIGVQARECSFEAYQGHNFCLTRSGHGTGFWDRGYPEPHASKCSDDSKSFGAQSLMLAEDGTLFLING